MNCSDDELDEYKDLLSNAGLGVWHIYLKDQTAPRMKADKKMAELLGINAENMTEEEIYSSWYDNIVPDAIPSVQASVQEMIDGNFSENTYQWKHPTKGILYVRCGGTAIIMPDGTQLLRGYHADVTEIVQKDKENTAELNKALSRLSQLYGMLDGFSQEYHTIWVVSRTTLKMSLIRSSGVSTIKNAVQLGKDFPDFDEALKKYIDAYVDSADQERLRFELSSKEVLHQLSLANVYTVNYLRHDDEGNSGYHQILFANADTNDGKGQFVYGFRDIDRTMKEELAKRHELEIAIKTAEHHSEELARQLDIVNTISKSYDCIYYVDLNTMHFIELGVNREGIHEVIGGEGNAKDSFEEMYKHLIVPEYLPAMRRFTNLSTIKSRLQKHEWISKQFESTISGWSEGIFIAANRQEDGSFDHIIWAVRNISADKRKEEKLIYASNTDELTGLFNRHAYEDAIKEYDSKGIPQNLLYISMDINGLKNINDTVGHAAGDELIIGAAECMKKCFNSYGRMYRTGGDEFSALLYASPKQIDSFKAKLLEATEAWHGKLVDRLHLSCGFVSATENTGYTMHDMAVLADKRMYADKSQYYRSKGVDRRGQKDAHVALCALYSKILRINVTDDSYQIISMYDYEKTADNGFSDNISEWLKNFALSGNVHPDDLDGYLSKTSIEYIRNYFKSGKNILHILYRRKYDSIFKQTIMEMVPTDDYSDEKQTLFLYVKSLE